MPIRKLENPFSCSREHIRQQSGIKILAAFNGELGAAIMAQKDSPVNYGSEFRNTAALTKYYSITRTGLRSST